MVTIKKETPDLVTEKKTENQETFVIIECGLIVCTVRQKAIFTKIEATDYTDALFKFKALRNIDRLPYHTMIIPESVINYYPKGV